jgi:hypothetical protein
VDEADVIAALAVARENQLALSVRVEGTAWLGSAPATTGWSSISPR